MTRKFNVEEFIVELPNDGEIAGYYSTTLGGVDVEGQFHRVTGNDQIQFDIVINSVLYKNYQVSDKLENYILNNIEENV